MELIVAICVGLGLSAAGGLRLFVPLLIAGASHRLGMIELAPALAWASTTPALIVVAVLSLVEGVGYCVPAVDHALDVVSAPAGWLAGALLSVGLVAPELHSTLSSTAAMSGFGNQGLYALGLGTAAITGAGAAGITQLTSAGGRLISTTTTGGIANPFYSAFESLLATVTSILAVFVPILLALMAIAGIAFAWMLLRRRSLRTA